MRAISRPFHASVQAFRELFRRAPSYRWFALASLLLIACTALIPVWKLLPLLQSQSFLPLHYNIYFGVDQFGAWYGLFEPAAIGLLILAVNVACEAALFRRERILSAFFAGATLLAEVILLAATAFTVWLNL